MSTSPVGTGVVKKKKSRSRAGCTSCKRLKIKCDEGKPSCEYCLHTRRECVYPPPAFINQRQNNGDVLVKQQIIFSYSKQLSLSRFELRMFKFFNDYCINLLTFGVNRDAELVWRNHIPPLFFASPLVRLAVFSFATINIWPFCDVSKLLEIDASNESQNIRKVYLMEVYKDQSEALGIVHHDSKEIFAKTGEYFMDTLSGSHAAMREVLKEPQTRDLQLIASSLISGILIIAFISIHPHRLLPLVDFGTLEKHDLTGGLDFLSFTKGYSDVNSVAAVHMNNSPLSGLFLFKHLVRNRKVGLLAVCNYLMEQIGQFYPFDEIDSSSASETNCFTDTVDLLKSCMQTTQKLRYPIPLFIWLLKLPPQFHQLVRLKHPLALKMLFVFSSLCVYCRFFLFSASSLWLDYMNWYYETHAIDDFEIKLYKLVVEYDVKIDLAKYSAFGSFDPVKEFDKRSIQTCLL